MPNNTDPATSVANVQGVVDGTLSAEASFPASAVQRVVEVKPFSAPMYDARSFTLPPYVAGTTPTLLLPYHAGRTRFVLRADFADVIIIGSLSNLSSGIGFRLAAGGQDFQTIDEVYVMNTDPANSRTVSLWAEYALD